MRRHFSEKIIKQVILIHFLLSLFLAYAQPTLAQTENAANTGPGPVEASIRALLCTPTEPSGPTAAQGNPASRDLFVCINRLYIVVIALGAVIAVFFIVVAGYIYISSDGNQESVGKAKEILVSTFTAMFIFAFGFVFLKEINPETVKFNSIQSDAVNSPCTVNGEELSVTDCLAKFGPDFGSVAPPGGGGGGDTPGKPTAGNEQKYKALIDKYAKERNIEYCALSALMQKESSFNYLIVSNGPPRQIDPNSANKQTYNITDFDAKYHAVGLTQVTIYEKRRGLNRGWTNGVPARAGREFGFSRPLYVTDLINPETNVQAGSTLWATDIAKENGNLYNAYRDYQGKNSEAVTLKALVDMYNACKRR